MAFTITEKILARAAGVGSCRAGDELNVKPDFVLGYDFPGYSEVFFQQMEEDFGITRLKEPHRYAFFIDHMVPAVTVAEEELHRTTRAWGARHQVAVHERKGIGHQVAAELGYATPGAFVLHFDGHISQLGAFGTLALGVRRHILEAMVKERIAIKVPETVRIDLTGTLPPGVMARDVFHHVVRILGAGSCRFKVVEFGGDAVAQWSVESRQTLCSLAMFTGAITAIINPDLRTLEHAQGRSLVELQPESSDADAVYFSRHSINVSSLEPVVVIPPNPANTRNLVDYLGTPVQVGYLGSCASGRLEDLRAAAHVLRGRHIQPGFQLHVVPTSQEIMSQAAREGTLADLIAAGAFLSSPSCDYCYGRIGVMGPGQRAISTGTLNVPGRMGSADSEIFLANAASVAAAALEGAVADPRKYLD